MWGLLNRRGVRSLSALCAALSALVLGPATPAQAEAVVDRESSTQTFSYSGSDFCFPDDLIGQATLTETTTGQRVTTPGGVMTVHGVDEFEYQIVFPDGRYVRSDLNRDHFAVAATPGSSVLTRVTQDFRTIYAADGTPIGSVMVHGVFHYTMHDGNLTALVEKFHVRCA
jgi:hypothetical protein